jgi:putative ABC transport system permease protein
MDWRDYVRHELPRITGNPARDADIVEELAQHLASRFDELRAGGVGEEEAQRRAAAELRNSAEVARAIRRADRLRPARPDPPPSNSAGFGADLPRDVSYALRMLRRMPGFTAAALLTLALGMGMTTAIFSVVQAVLLRPVPFPEPDRLVMMWETDRNSGTTREPASIPDFVDYRQRSRQVDAVGAFVSIDLNLSSDRGDPRRLSALAATPELLQLLGVRAIAGRSFTAEEDRPRRPRVVMISDALWQQLYGRDSAAIGATIRLNDVPAVIVGVVPPTADFGVLQILSAAAYARGFADRDPRARVDIWTPLQADPANAPRGGNHSYIMIGRLAESATVSSAHDEMVSIAADLERTYPRDNQGRGAFVELLDDVVFGRTRPALAVLMAAVSLVLLIACVNVANLLIARGTTRAHEIAIRTALGARLSRLARQFAVENVVLALGGAALGVPLAYAVLRALVAVGPANIPRLATVGLDARVLLVALGMSVIIGMVFGILPVAQARRTDVQTALKAGGGRDAAGRRDGRFARSALVVAEVALAVVLVVGAGLLTRSFWNLSRTDPGFDAAGVLKAEFRASPAKYANRGDGNAAPHFVAYNRFTSGLLEPVTRLPGVESAALAANHPLDTGYTQSFLVVGREAEARDWPELPVRHVSPGYFRTLRVPLLRGRLLGDADTSSSPPVVVVNQTMAERFFPDQDPVGQKIRFWGTDWMVVGVVGNERFQGIAKAPPAAAYAPLPQTRFTSLAMIVRTSVDPVEMASSVRAAIREADPELAVFGLEPLRDTIANSLGEQRFMMLLLGLFGALAVCLAAIGVHGVLTWLVAQRTREIGVRMALGATSARVVHLVVGQGARLVGIGLAIGLALALGLGRAVSGLLYGVTPTDGWTLATALAVIGGVAALSIWLPARRAVRLDPVSALRQE